MHAATDRLEFAPPPTPGNLRALGLAVLAHAVLLAALTWGVHWKREALSITAEAELWSTVPQQAAPKLVEVPPPPAVREAKVTPATAPPQVQPKLPDPEIALSREKLRLKKKQELDREKELEKQRLEKLEQEKLLLEKKRVLDKRLQDKRELDKKTADAKKSLIQCSSDRSIRKKIPGIYYYAYGITRRLFRRRSGSVLFLWFER